MANPVLTVSTSNFTASGFNRLTWTNANKGSNWYSWRVYRKLSSDTAYSLLKEYVVDQSNYTYDDYASPENVSVDYVVIRVFLSSGVPTEEAVSGTQTVTPASDNYWLIHPYDSSKNILLYNVTDDSLDIRTDTADLDILGRGTKTDFGSTFGTRGTVSSQIRDKSPTITAIQQWNAIQTAVKEKTFYWLRNPFGDVKRVSLKNLKGKPIPGVGTQRFMDIGFEYTEVVP